MFRSSRSSTSGTPTTAAAVSGPRSLSRVIEGVVQHARALQLLLLVVGVLGLGLVPLLERRIEFDENALLAGSARPTISHSTPSALEAGKAFADSLTHTYNSFLFSTALQEAIQAAGWQVSHHTFTAGWQVSHHTFTAATAAGAAGTVGSSSSSSSWAGSMLGVQQQKQQQQQQRCVNVHAVLHSPRGDGKEALLLVTPVNHQHFATDFQQDASGVRLSLALGYALLQHLSSAAWLSKEVVWLLPDASCGLLAAVEAWTHTYQLLPLDAADSQPHFRRAGVLQQALLLELPSGVFNRAQVSLEGHDGQLPKLDMFYLFRWYCQAYVTAPVELAELRPTTLWGPLEALHATLAPLLTPLMSLFNNLSSQLLGATNTPTAAAGAEAASVQLRAHLHKLQVMWQFMSRQAKGVPTGAHAAFKALGVDAATLRLLVRDDAGRIVGPVGYLGAGNDASIAAAAAAAGFGAAGGGGRGGPTTAAAAAAVEAGPGPYSWYSTLGDSAAAASLVGSDPALLQLGNVLEAVLRSCSVLIERFHHSLFLYVLTGLDSYVSVERYIGPLVALICVLALQAAHLSRLLDAPTHLSSQRLDTGSSKAPVTTPSDTPAAAATAEATAGGSAAAATTATAGHTGSSTDAATDISELLSVLEANSLQLPASQADAAAARQQWVAALQLVLLAHAAAVAAAAAVRSPWVLLQHAAAAVSGQGGGDVGSSNSSSLLGVGVGAGVLLLLLVGEGLMSLSSNSSSGVGSSGGRRGRSSGRGSSSGGSSSRRVFLTKVLVVEFTVASAVLAAVACINWALGYAACCVLVPLALVTSGHSSSSSSASSNRALIGIVQGSVLLICCPVALLVLLCVWSPCGVGGSVLSRLLQLRWWWGLVGGSSWGTYLVSAGLHLPLWCMVLLCRHAT